MPVRKKVIYMVIDSFHPRALEHGIGQGLLPAFSFLIENGRLYPDCISVFPTVTPACTASLTTGAPPSLHGIPGIVWYHRGERRIIDYGSNWYSILRNGLVQAAQEYLFNLNHKHLGWQVRTIYEDLESKGYFTAASNPIIYRGNKEYLAQIPLLIKLVTLFQVDDRKIYGPKGFLLGKFYQPPGELRQSVTDIRYWPRFAVNDRFSARAAQWFLQQKPKPDLLTVYFPDTDKQAHKKDADCCNPCLTKVDKRLQELLNGFPSWQKALEECIFIVVGDHGQSTIQGRKSLVRIDKLLNFYSQARIGENPVEEKDIAICSNERLAYIYILRYRPGMRRSIAECLIKEPNVDQVIWQDQTWYYVVTSKGKLSFRKKGNLQDSYGNCWEITGEPEILDMKIEGNVIHYNTYPNALERIFHCLDNPNAGELVVTAKPGYLLAGAGAPPWPGKGSHGSLYREDSLVPLIISGTSATMEKPRITDVVPFIKSLFH